jgi:peptidoglycan/xylan/chitin deacetylase (PgdA/CDA1 family)
VRPRNLPFRPRTLAAALAFLAFSTLAPAASAGDYASVLIFHRFGESALPSTSISLDELDAYIKELKSGPYHVMPLGEIIDAFRAHRPLPDRTVAITVDDAFESAYTRAWPRLKAAGLPLTLFVATKPVDGGYRDFMSWDQIRALAAAGVEIGAHSETHPHMPELTPEQVAREIADSNARFKAELGKVPTLFAYPYGESSAAVRDAVIRAGYRAAMGQQSGVAYAGGDLYFLPRFSFDEDFASIERFRLAVNALPFPITDLTPVDPLVRVNPPTLGFTVDPAVGDLKRINCYAVPARKLTISDMSERRIEIRLDRPFAPGRARVNCTAPGPDKRWRWFGDQFYIEK